MRLHVTVLLICLAVLAQAQTVKVTIDPAGGLSRNGQHFFIKGAGGREHLDELVRRGGNSVRTWGDKELIEVLPRAKQLGLTVCAGIWLEHECSWFSYHNPAHCARQTERVRKVVVQYRDHPSLLLWGLGNESEGDGTNADYWKQINRLAQMVHEEDPHHPTLTAVAGLSAAKAEGLNQHAPALDLVGINTYGALPGLREHLAKVSWTRPWVVTEYGPQGFWESPRTPWGSPREQTSTQKAEMIRRNYVKTIAPAGACLGAYVFLWGQKQEATATWFGLFTDQGESTAVVDVMQELWTGQTPTNRSPDLTGLKADRANLSVKAGETFQIKATAHDPDTDALQTRWEVSQDEPRRNAEGREQPLPKLDGRISTQGMTATITAPEKAGNYRVFVFVSDTHGHVATGNVPFQVQAKPGS